MKLTELLSIRPGITALTGSGGKTTTLYLLANELQLFGTVLCTTTTHIRPPAHIPLLTTVPTCQTLSSALRRHRCLCIGTPAEHNKLTAPLIPIRRLAELADYVLVEADGSRGLPLKAHLPHEPVVPPGTAQTILLLGASGFHRPAWEVVHRPDLFCSLADISPQTPVTAQHVASVLLHENPGGKIFINQVECSSAADQARLLASLLPWPVFAGSLKGGTWTCLS
ncbi:MAG: putative selenium-dependent hydroxylase accessory protein YqeC [Oscillospiraceae bacterium]|nr:putative selenium-dependent hydroxylase accessory protein YqeC [Oscillospiraceae bacterium]